MLDKARRQKQAIKKELIDKFTTYTRAIKKMVNETNNASEDRDEKRSG